MPTSTLHGVMAKQLWNWSSQMSSIRRVEHSIQEVSISLPCCAFEHRRILATNAKLAFTDDPYWEAGQSVVASLGLELLLTLGRSGFTLLAN